MSRAAARVAAATQGPKGPAMRFTGSQYLVVPEFDTNTATAFIVSFWLRLTAEPAGDEHIFTMDAGGAVPSSHAIRIGTNKRLTYVLTNSNGNGLGSWQSSILTVGLWYHFLIRPKKGAATTQYVSEVGSSKTWLSQTGAPPAARECVIGGNHNDGGAILDLLTSADLADFYFNPVDLDTTLVANRREFSTDEGKMVDLGDAGENPTGASPYLYFRDPTDWQTGLNRGYGDNAAVTGSLKPAPGIPNY
ncbi:MAG: hypothetical protein ACPGO3_00455 [Magnetospiraceae bacterium]